MTFTKQGEFTKDVLDLTDVPSQNMTPSQMKSYFQTPSDELKTTVNKLVDDLNTTTDWTKNTGDHKGTWQGFTPTQVDQTLKGRVDGHDTQLADIKKKTDWVSVEEFGAKSILVDATFDSTLKIIDAINYCNTNKKVLFCPGLYKITGALTATGGIKGIVFPYISYGDGVSGTGFVCEGSGYTALTANCFLQNVTVHGKGNTVNGILWQNPFLIYDNNVRVYNLNGFGVKINKVWDSIFDSISTELCGSGTEYAFSMNDDGDTCNMTHILRLQVEKANVKAIYISPNTLSCVIDNIHSEQATGNGANYTWVLGGNRCQYNSFRLEANSNGKVLLSGASTTYVTPLIEGGIIKVDYEGFSGANITFIGGEIQSPVGERQDQFGKVLFIKTKLNNLSTGNTGLNSFENCEIGTLTVGFCTEYIKVKGGSIASLDQNSSNSYIKCTGTKISAVVSIPALSQFIDSDITTATLSIAYKYVALINSAMNGNVNLDFGTLVLDNSRINGNLTQSAGPHKSQFKNYSVVTGSVDGLLLTSPSGGTWVQGDKHQNLKPSAGGYEGWLCTLGGTPGTWKGFGLIQA